MDILLHREKALLFVLLCPLSAPVRHGLTQDTFSRELELKKGFKPRNTVERKEVTRMLVCMLTRDLKIRRSSMIPVTRPF